MLKFQVDQKCFTRRTLNIMNTTAWCREVYIRKQYLERVTSFEAQGLFIGRYKYSSRLYYLHFIPDARCVLYIQRDSFNV